MPDSFAGRSPEERILWYKTQIKALMDLLVDKQTLSREDRATAKARMDEIKERFRGDRKVGGSSRRFDAMSPEEQLYYSTVMEAATRISVKSNSHPIRSHWFDDLYSCRIDLDFYYPKVKVG